MWRKWLSPRVSGVIVVTVIALGAIACTDEEAQSADRPLVPTPVGAVVRKNCETIAASETFLSEEERAWFNQNCNRLNCAVIRGTPYLSPVERDWYLKNCP